MEKPLRRFLSLILCAALMVCLPGQLVRASEVETEETMESLPGESTAESVPEDTTQPVPETTADTIPEEPEQTTGASEPDEPTLSTESTLPGEETAPTAEETLPEETAFIEFLSESPEFDIQMEWNLYFGQLHSHSSLSDGTGSVEDAFEYAFQVENLDFFALTDHSDSFDHGEEGAISVDGASVSRDWARGRAAAAAVTGEDFVGIFGYEMSWPEGKNLGHINTFCTPGWQSWKQEAFSNSLENYYGALTTVPGSVSQFNHPGPQYGDFENFSHYSPEYDRQICLLEVAGEGSFTAYKEYTKALDQGWHVAPTTGQNNHSGHWGDARQDRTVVLAKFLTESSLLSAMRAHRVYATADGDLTIYYELNGHIMGSILETVRNPEISVYLRDPSDGAVGLVEVIVDGGRVADSIEVTENEDLIYLYPAGGYSYYYLRITQPDGDIAVTAPVWTGGFEDLGISGFEASTQAPTQGQSVDLTVTLYNSEPVECLIDKLEVSIGDALIHSADIAGSLGAGEVYTYTFPYTHPGLGTTDLRLTVTGRADGALRIWNRTLTLQYLPGQLVTGLLIDGNHGGLPALGNLSALAGRANMEVTVFDGAFPLGGEILLIFSPERAFEDAFLEEVRRFAEGGGSVILCGRSDRGDGAVHGAGELNRVLGALGSTMGFHDNTTVDPTHHGQRADQLFPTSCNTASAWCAGLTTAQYYAHLEGCTVDQGQGTWLVQGFASTERMDLDGDGDSGGGRVLLASEATPWGGQILAAGSAFLSDESMPLPEDRWSAPRINQSILEQLLNTKKEALPVTEIRALRTGERGQVYRVQGYVTAGTSNSGNRFPETIYLQDATGGIAVVPFRAAGIQVGTPMDVTGYLDEENGMPLLRWIDYDIPDRDAHRYVPKTSRNATAMHYAKSGGSLMQVEGRVTELVLAPDGRGISRLVLRDYLGEDAVILIEDYIRSGSTGENRLADQIKPGAMVRAIGISHLDETGTPVLRVRNCEEVVYIPPKTQLPSDNPKTGEIPGRPVNWLQSWFGS